MAETPVSSDSAAQSDVDNSQPGWSDLPAEDWNELVSLYNSGQLSGVPAEDLAAIFQAEGSNTYGAVNSAGYGGYFGLGSSYDQESFANQAEAASAIYATGLQASQGNPDEAEAYYQTGSIAGDSSGVGDFESWGIGSTDPDELTPIIDPATGQPSNNVTLTLASQSKNTSTDILTQAMIQLNLVMHPSTSKASSILTLEVAPTVEMIFSRGMVALGFAAAGALAIFGVLGGKSFGSSLPGIAAGFLAGPEVGLANAASKLGLPKTSSVSQPSEASQARLALAQQREGRVAQTAQDRAQKIQQQLSLSSQRENRLQQRQQQAPNPEVVQRRLKVSQYRARTQRMDVERKQRAYYSGTLGLGDDD